MFTPYKHLTFFSLAFLIIPLYFMNAQEAKTSKDPGPSLERILQHTTVEVTDFDKSRKFYSGVLGLKDLQADWLPENQMFLSLGTNRELHKGEVDGLEIDPSNFNHFALSVPNFDAFLLHLKKHGVAYAILGGGNDYFVQTRPDGVRQTLFKDPDGYWIEVNDMK